MFTLLLAGLALFGAVQLLMYCYKRFIQYLVKNRNWDDHKARMYIPTLINDYRYHHGSFLLEQSKFYPELFNDISSMLSDSDFQKWYKRFGMIGMHMVESGMDAGLPYLKIKLYVPDEVTKSEYEAIIRQLAYNTLTEIKCFGGVIITWNNPLSSSDTDSGDYQFCTIKYARTFQELEVYSLLIRHMNEEINRLESSEISDEELDLELKDIHNER